ncbi:hypothetical protein ACFC58_38195 [Kitasatospora purpeofusca]|uniref:hypothetical protein n=1 Tax=Kitasatospora purpeofusca TaxID=67352 RepID=UPI0035DDD026
MKASAAGGPGGPDELVDRASAIAGRLERIGELRQALGNDGVVGLVRRASVLPDGSLRDFLALADNLGRLEQDIREPE